VVVRGRAMTKTTFAEIEPVMEECTKAEVTSAGAPWDLHRTMVNADPTKGYYLTKQEFEQACARIALAFNNKSGNGAAGIPVDLSDATWQAKYQSKDVQTFISAASIRAEQAANGQQVAGV
jgi:hypothetical protein